jgi:hypothetical protein
MWMRNFIALPILGVLLSACCTPIHREEPLFPADATGWSKVESTTNAVEGNLVIKKGERSDNGKIGVSVIEIIPGSACAEGGSQERQARVKLQFVRIPAGQILCEDVFPENGTIRLSATACESKLDGYGIRVIGVKGINLTQQWVNIVF